jgi:hypothetical protein
MFVDFRFRIAAMFANVHLHTAHLFRVCCVGMLVVTCLGTQFHAGSFSGSSVSVIVPKDTENSLTAVILFNILQKQCQNKSYLFLQGLLSCAISGS